MGSMGKFLGSLYFHFQQEVCFQSLGGPGVVGFCLDQFLADRVEREETIWMKVKVLSFLNCALDDYVSA